MLIYEQLFIFERRTFFIFGITFFAVLARVILGVFSKDFCKKVLLDGIYCDSHIQGHD